MPKTPRGKRVTSETTGRYTVVGKAPNGQAEPYFDRTRGVWVAPWRRPDGKVGKPTGKTRVLAEASRDRHIAEAQEVSRAAPLAEGFNAQSTIAELTRWWLDNVARHQVRASSWATYSKQASVLDAGLGNIAVRALRTEQVTTFMSDLIDHGSPSRAKNVRTLLVQVLDQAVTLGLAADNVARKVRPPRVPRVQRRTLTPVEVGTLLAACEDRFAGAVALCYVQGWRVSEALGLAWQDLDLDAGAVALRRCATYADGVGMILGPTKTERTAGRQLLAPTVIEHLRRRQAAQQVDIDSCLSPWPSVVYDGEPIDLVFTTPTGRPVLRQHVDRAIRVAAAKANLDPSGLGTHAGRRSVVTNLYASGSLDLADVARFVGHADTSTTRGYVQNEGDRPRQVSEKAFRLLDPSAGTNG
jgi:integrase